MSTAEVANRIEYPESDGKPMGETDLHRDWMIRILDILRYRYRRQKVYLASDLLVYYEEGATNKYVVPDVFFVADCPPGRRRTFKIWEEGRVPDVVFEVTSLGTRREDEIFKLRVYARLGVKEYFLYDPTSDYLQPPLQGYRLVDDSYRRIASNDAGDLQSERLDVRMRLEQGELVMIDAATGQTLLSEAEAERAARQAERAAREIAEARTAELEAEIERLRQLLKSSDGSP
jgi:Uma2 family endonuclease